MSNKAKDGEVLQWHPAFYAGIQIELQEENDNLIFENEHQLGTKPKEIDVLIIKKQKERKIQKNIGRIFRKHNIVEYKSPDDYLSIDDFYKVYGYACFYKSDVSKVDLIKAEEITITFVCKNYPRKMAQHLRKIRHLEIEKQEEGIYYILGDTFPVQLILTSELSHANNFWLRNLTNDLKSREIAEELVEKYGKHQEENRYKSVMDIIVKANKELFQEVNNMCDALMEIVHDKMEAKIKEEVEIRFAKEVEDRLEKEVEDRFEKEVESRLVKEVEKLHKKTEDLVRKKLAKGKSAEEIADALEEPVETIEALIKTL